MLAVGFTWDYTRKADDHRGGPVLWLDTVLTTPTVGLLFERWFVSSSEVLTAVRPVLERWRRAGQTVDVAGEGPVVLAIRSSSGINVAVEQENLVVQFSYPAEVRERVGDVPEFHYPVPVQPYSAVLPLVLEAATEVASTLQEKYPRKLRRIGVIAAARFDARAPAPGVKALMDQCTRPWGDAEILRCTTHITATLSKHSDGKVDRCHHQLDFNIDRGNDMRCSLDWQRHFPAAHAWPSSSSKARDLVTSATKDAVDYFQRFGEGDLNYDED